MSERIFDVEPYAIATNHIDDARMRLIESMTSIGNGYMGMRGTFEEGYSGDTHVGTYIAGVWFPDKTLSAVAEGVAAAASLILVVIVWRRLRRRPPPQGGHRVLTPLSITDPPG